MKKLLTLFFSTITIFVFSQKIVWEEGKKLNWNLFKSKENSMKNDTMIVSYSSCGLKYTAAKDKTNNRIKIKIDATFDPAKSWKDLIKTKGLSINHEQGHFDIAEIYARKLRKEFIENVKTEKDYQLKFKLIYQVLYGEFLDYQYYYDGITKKGTKPDKQKELEAEIKAQLKKLEPYKN
jgi:hypothetical protein